MNLPNYPGKKANLPDFTERLKPPVTGLVEQDRNTPFSPTELFAEQLKLLADLLVSIRANVPPEFDATFSIKENIITVNTDMVTYETRMFQYVIVNPTSATLRIGFGEGGNVNLPYRYDVPTAKIFVSPVSFFSKLSFAYAASPTVPTLAFCYAYNRILHTPGMYALT